MSYTADHPKDALAAAVQAVHDANADLQEAAAQWARRELLAYSKAHPRRTVKLSAGMGTITLFVSPGGTRAGRHDYQLSDHECEIGDAPAFLVRIGEIEHELGLRGCLFDAYIVAKGGAVLNDKA